MQKTTAMQIEVISMVYIVSSASSIVIGGNPIIGAPIGFAASLFMIIGISATLAYNDNNKLWLKLFNAIALGLITSSLLYGILTFQVYFHAFETATDVMAVYQWATTVTRPYLIAILAGSVLSFIYGEVCRRVALKKEPPLPIKYDLIKIRGRSKIF